MNYFNTSIQPNTHPAFGTPRLDPLSLEATAPLLCHYINSTSQIQITRIANIPNWYFERVVFPGQHLLFEAPSWAELEIYTAETHSALLSNKITCDCLRVEEGILNARS